MKTFGLIVADNGSSWFFQGTGDPAWGQPRFDTMIAQLETVPASAFEAVDESSLELDPSSGRARQPATATPVPTPTQPPSPPPTTPTASTAPTASPRPAQKVAKGPGCHPLWAPG